MEIKTYLGRFSIAVENEEEHEALFQALHENNVLTPFGNKCMTVSKNFGQRSNLRISLD